MRSDMDEYNYSTPRRGLTLIAIAILGFCIYRTETTRKDVAEISAQVSAMNERLDSVIRTRASQSAQKPSTRQKPRAQAATPTSSENTTSDRASISTSAASTPAPSGNATLRRVSITAKAKVENRYLRDGAILPKITYGPIGIVVINATMDFLGTVNAVSVNPRSTINDEEIIDACKEAALRTEFSSNTDAPRKQTGTITYTFLPK